MGEYITRGSSGEGGEKKIKSRGRSGKDRNSLFAPPPLHDPHFVCTCSQFRSLRVLLDYTGYSSWLSNYVTDIFDIIFWHSAP